MDIHDYLRTLAEQQGSDLFFSVGAPVTLKREGEFVRLNETQVLEKGQVKTLAYALMSAKQIEEFETQLEMNLALGIAGVGRFRVNVYWQRGEVTMVVRFISDRIASFAELGLPRVLEKLSLLDRGLILVTGATGCGKSTTLAAMIDYRNRCRSGHIVCIEDPIEFLHHHQCSIVDQREVGLDTHSFKAALHNVLRESPDVIMIGEIRDRETMQHALHYSETGHLVLATLHATNTVQAVERIANLFPEEARTQVLNDISMNMVAIIGQRLANGVKKQRLPVVEMLLRTPYIVNLIARDELHDIKAVMSRGTDDKALQTYDQHLFRLLKAREITLKEALRLADSRNDLMLRAKLEDQAKDNSESVAPAESTSDNAAGFDSDLTEDFR